MECNVYCTQVQSSGNNVKEGHVKRNGGGMFLLWWRYYTVDGDGRFDLIHAYPRLYDGCYVWLSNEDAIIDGWMLNDDQQV